MIRIDFVDDARRSWLSDGPRPLAVTIWYPAAADSEMSVVAFPQRRPIFVGGYAAQGAQIADETRRPLALVSHGTGGSALQTMWLGRALAAEGYIVAAISHHGNTAAEPTYDPRGFRMPWHRAIDLSIALDRLLAHDVWGPRIDRARVHAVGFSLGGYTVAALAGGRTDLDRLAAFCAGPLRDATCDPQPEYPEATQDFEALLERDPSLMRAVAASAEDYSDPRFRRFVALAPALVQAFTDESLSSITRPMLIIGLRDDEIAPVATNAQRLADLTANNRLVTLTEANHFDFLNTCTAFGRRVVPICSEGAASREAVHERAVAEVLSFLGDTR